MAKLDSITPPSSPYDLIKIKELEDKIQEQRNEMYYLKRQLHDREKKSFKRSPF